MYVPAAWYCSLSNIQTKQWVFTITGLMWLSKLQLDSMDETECTTAAKPLQSSVQTMHVTCLSVCMLVSQSEKDLVLWRRIHWKLESKRRKTFDRVKERKQAWATDLSKSLRKQVTDWHLELKRQHLARVFSFISHQRLKSFGDLGSFKAEKEVQGKKQKTRRKDFCTCTMLHSKRHLPYSGSIYQNK